MICLHTERPERSLNKAGSLSESTIDAVAGFTCYRVFIRFLFRFFNEMTVQEDAAARKTRFEVRHDGKIGRE